GGGTPGPDPPAAEPHLTDVGNAERFVADHAKSLRWCDPWKTWLRWDGCRWLADDTRVYDRLARRTIADPFREASRQIRRLERILRNTRRVTFDRDAVQAALVRQQRLQAHALRSEDAKRQSALLALARTDLAVVPDDLNRHPWLLNCPNGTLDL